MPKYEDTIPCQAQDCTRKTSPLTVRRNGGFCHSCAQSKPDELIAFIKARQGEVNPFKDMTDPVEILKTMHRQPNQDVFVKELDYPLSQEEVCASLNPQNAIRVLEYIVDLASNKQMNTACSLAISLKMTTSLDLTPLLKIQVSNPDTGFLPFLFKDSLPEIRDELIQRIDENPDLYLQDLVWIGDTATVKQIALWKNQKPIWSEHLFCSPADYALLAGWELTAAGQRRELCSEICIPLIQFDCVDAGDGVNLDAAIDTSALEVVVDASSECPWCHRRLVYLFDVNATSGRLKDFTQVRNHLRFLFCEACVWPAGFIFTRMSKTGDAIWCESNSIGNASPLLKEPNVPRKQLRLGRTRRNSYFACTRDSDKGISQIGGYPNWLQDSDYPTCPGCAQTMHFFGQVAYQDVDPDSEGIFYSFSCNNCLEYLAVSFQTT